MTNRFEFLGSNRFWVLVVGCLGVAAEGGFTKDAWMRAVIALASGFITIRTVDRATEVLSSTKEPPVSANEAGD